ncbi:MAG: radical SAM/SPASM domain-containing protein [Planctomycetota bacterium]
MHGTQDHQVVDRRYGSLMVRRCREVFHNLAPIQVRKIAMEMVPKTLKDKLRYAAASLRSWERLEDNPPQTLKFETTNICNANCIFCGYQYHDREKGVMPLELYKRAIDEYAAMGGTSIGLTPVVGDPLVDPHIIERITIAIGTKQITDICLYTNGILLNKNNTVDELLQSGLKTLYVSTAGFEREMFERVYRSKKYDDLLAGVTKLLRRNKELGELVTIVLEFRPDKAIEEVLNDKDFVEHVKEHIPEKRISWLTAFDNWGSMITEDQLSGTMKMATVPDIKRRPCARTFTAMVMWDGSIRACSCRFKAGSFDDHTVGDINDGKTLESVWKGQPVRDFRRTFVNDELRSACQSCSSYEPI